LIGQVEIFAFPFVPAGWLPCDGRLLQIAYYQPVFSLLGTSYGGDGRISFALPKMSVPNSQGQHYCIAVQGAYPSR
jgi:microcystin-dependent protein